MTKLTGGNVNYYLVSVKKPKRLTPYEAECEDIIRVLGMTFAEGNCFKAIWRSAAARLGNGKPGADAYGIYDAEKIKHYGAFILDEREQIRDELAPKAAPQVPAPRMYEMDLAVGYGSIVK